MDVVTHLASIENVGYTIVENVIDRDHCEQIKLRVAELETTLQIGCGDNLFEGYATTRVYNLLAHGEIFEAIPVHPGVLPIVEGVLDSELLISSLSSIRIGPGESAQPLHADDQLIPLPRPHVPIVCNTMWAIDDFTEANGATRLVEGSHKESGLPDYRRPPETIAAEMQAGSVLIWTGSLWHGGGANVSEAHRLGIAMNYCAGWVRQQENQQLGISKEVASTFSPRLRKLCGYSVYRGLIGHIDKRDPSEVALDLEPEATMAWDSLKRR